MADVLFVRNVGVSECLLKGSGVSVMTYEVDEETLNTFGVVPTMKPDLSNTGLYLVILGSAISCCGVLWNNIYLDHLGAMLWWRWSNILFAVFFFGRLRKWWEGGLSDAVMCGLYMFMAATNEWGLGHVG